MADLPITTIFLDVGGVLLTNAWDRNARRRATQTFGLDYDELNERHHLTFDTYEEGRLSLNEYLDRVIFYQERPFSRQDFKAFMFAQSQPYPEMIDLLCQLRARYGLKMVVVNNEGRELNVQRIRQFELARFVDFFVSSCFVHFRKPAKDIYLVALDIAQVSPEQVVYLEDRAMFVEVAQGLGLKGIHHTDYEATRSALGALGLSVD